jgi:hypothetical protein
VDRRLGDRQGREGSVEKITLSDPCQESKCFSLVAHLVAEVFYWLNYRGPYNNNNNANNNNYAVLSYISIFLQGYLYQQQHHLRQKDGKADVGDNDANDSNDDGGAPRISHALCSCDLKHK